MNRKEAVIYLIENPNGKIKMIKNSSGKDKVIFYILDSGVIKSIDGFGMLIYFQNDKAEFEVVRELRKMSFGVAYKTMIELNKPYSSLVSLISDKNYVNPIWNFSDEELEGKWTVEGVYED